MNYKEFSAKIKAKYPGKYDDLADEDLAKRMVAKYPQYSDVTFEEPKPGMIKKAWQALAIPEQKAKEGLQALVDQIPKMEPTGNLIKDIALGAPRIIPETIAEAAPGFISRGSIVTAGALKGIQAAKPVIAAAGRGMAKGAEGLSGLEFRAPGVLKEVFHDPGLLLAKGKDAASQLFKIAKAGKETSRLTDELISHKEIVNKATKLIDKGAISAVEAHVARRSVDALMKSKEFSREALLKLRAKFDAIVKSDKSLKQADAAFQRGAKADAMRTLFPTNKLGGTSAIKSAALAAIAGGAGAINPISAVLAPIAFSPLVQSGIAAGAGLASKVVGPIAKNPGLVIAIKEALSKRRSKEK